MVLEHLMTFNEYQIRSMVQGYTMTLDDESELDIFLNNMKCGV